MILIKFMLYIFFRIFYNNKKLIAVMGKTRYGKGKTEKLNKT